MKARAGRKYYAIFCQSDDLSYCNCIYLIRGSNRELLLKPALFLSFFHTTFYSLKYKQKMSPTLYISDIPELNRNHVKIKNKEKLEEKLTRLVENGTTNLQIVADFDCTLTKQVLQNGRKPLSSFGMFGSCPSVPQSYKDAEQTLCAYYKPIEVDPTLTVEEKTPHMITWYKKAQQLLRGFKFPDEELSSVAAEVAKDLRDGTESLIDFADEHNIPVLVFSAGLGDSVVKTLEEAKLLRSNVKVISNFLNIHEDGLIDGMKNEIIHVFNKNETAIKNTEYFELVKNRTNVLLMGDSIGDASMADGMDHCELTIKIGFLYHHAEEYLSKYMDHFDIVLIDDQSMDVPNSILNILI